MKLSLQGITKSYGSNLALDRFTAELEPGIHALLGIVRDGK
jgi:ABC-type sugar transport system ATPase subunit